MTKDDRLGYGYSRDEDPHEKGENICDVLLLNGFQADYTIDNFGELFIIVNDHWILRYLGIRDVWGNKEPLWGPVRPRYSSLMMRQIRQPCKIEYDEIL